MKLLIIKFGALGDVVMATPLIAAIQSTHPKAEIHLLTTPPFAPIFSAWPALRVHAFERSGWRAMAAMLRFIRTQHFDRIYDLQGNDRSGLLCALSGAPARVGNHPRYPYTHHPTAKWRGQSHIFERMKLVLQSAGVNVDHELPILPLGEAERHAVDEWLGRVGLAGQRFVILHAGASAARPEKCWSGYAELATRLSERGLIPVWIGAHGEKAQNERLQRRTGGVDASGQFTVPALAYFGQHAVCAVTNDSGPMHVLAAAGIPVFALFGPSDWRRNHALGQRDNVITAAGDAPTDSIDVISVEQILSRLDAAGIFEQAEA